jgi:release factor glutamine methyltransferase
MTFEEKLQSTCKIALEKGKEDSACLFLMSELTGYNTGELYFHQKEIVPSDIEAKYDAMFDKYINENIPVQYLTGKAYFYGYEFHVNENVLIPRPETEQLVENMLLLYDRNLKGQKVDVVDIGTGSGCIATTLALEEKNMNVSATDISKEALEVASANAKRLGANVNFMQGDMLQPVMDKKFDILVSNPPYIPDSEIVDPLVKDNEPNVALFGGDDGLKFYRIILKNSVSIMKEKCIIGFEHGYNKSREIEDLAHIYYPDANIYTLKDYQGLDRMTFVVRGYEHDSK